MAATWPLVRAVSEAVTLGTELNATPTLHGIWSLWWVADRAAHGFAGLWDAPVFFPQHGAFTFSEPMLLLGAAATPLWLAGLPPAACHNAVLLAVLTLNGVCAGRLALALGAGRPAALLGAVLAATLPAVAKLSGVVAVLPFFGLLLAVEGLVEFGGSGSRRAAAKAAAGLAVQGLTSLQIALLGLPLLLLAGGAALAARRFRPEPLRRLALTLCLCGALLVLVLLPTLRTHRELGLRRSAAEFALGSARPGDFLTRPFTSPLTIPRRESLERDTSGLFPGFLLLGLAAVGTASGARGRWRAWVLVLAAAAGLQAALALGANLDVAGTKPLAALHEAVPGFGGLRSPFRSAVIAQAILAVLAALGVDALAGASRGRPRLAAAVALGLLAAAENLCVPSRVLDIPRSPRTAWSAWLRSQPPGTTVVHLPLPAGDGATALEAEAWRLFHQIDHRQPMLNGYSSHFPPHYDRYQGLPGESILGYQALCALSREAGINTVVVDRSWLTALPAEARRLLRPAYLDADVQICRLAPSPADCLPQP